MAPSVRGPDFWRRRFAAFRSPGRLDQNNPKPSTQIGANKPAASRAIVPAPDPLPKDNEPEIVISQEDAIPSTPLLSQGSGRSKRRRNQRILVKDDQTCYYRSRMPFPWSTVSALQSNPSAGQGKGSAEPKGKDRYEKLPDGKKVAAASPPETLGDILAASKPASPKLAAGQPTVSPRSPDSTRRDLAGAASRPSEDQSDEQSELEARVRSDVSQDRQVVAVQRALNEHGRNQLKLTGKVDAETAEVIRRFERERKLPVTGQVSSRLMRELSITADKSIKKIVPTTYEGSAPKEISSNSDEAPPSAPEGTNLPTFRWPVRGKVIVSYGSTTTGKANDGINIAVPIDTPVKAAEDGVVVYSGSELKGYGILVLVRHSNGYVTAYGYLSELLVKRGDTIKRGDVIAKSGSSGGVASPQLHFEIRKGTIPVDPLRFLNGA